MKSKPNLEEIDAQLQAIKPKAFYNLMATIFLILAGLFTAKGLADERSLFVAVGGIFLVVAVAIWAIGRMAHTYKAIIESLLDEIDYKQGSNIEY